ncbi:MAG TPA: CocE/NonD family hydrolase [Acidimicrobiia bacterium]|nr:CocE/NonD family hydrolase [Acidimicrobiia bacterium]
MRHARMGRRRAGVVLVLATASVLAVMPLTLRGAGADPLPATFSVQGSVEQIAITHATPGAMIGLYSPGGEALLTGTVDEQGSYLFRDVVPGSGYLVRQDAGGVVTEALPVHVMATTDTPPQAFYDSQVLDPGFGYITTRDGTTLSVTVRLPGPPENGPYPTVVEYSGYTPSNPNSLGGEQQFAGLLGYATVGVNLRGTGCSGGAFWYFEDLQGLDGYDVIETVAAQPWVKHGKVGMVGVSYPGITQLFVGATQPPHLAAITPLSVIADTYRSTLYPGGIFNDGFALDWAQGRANDARPYGQGWTHDIVDAGGADGAECAENQLLRLQSADLLGLIEANPHYVESLMDPLAPVTFVDRIKVPTLLAGAFQDEQTGGQFPILFDEFTLPPGKMHFMATNGTHADSLLAQFNRWFEFLEFYVAKRVPVMPSLIRSLAPSFIASSLGIPGYSLEADRFTDHPTYASALADYESERPFRVMFENGGVAGKPGTPGGTFERSFAQWPPARATATPWYFQPDRELGTAPPAVADDDGKAATAYVYDPTAKPRRSYAGNTTEIFAALPDWDWRTLPIGKALAFDSPPLADELIVAGSASVDLWLRSTAADTDVEVTITELRPDGDEMYVQSGWLRASHRALDAARSTDLAPWHTHDEADAAPLPSGEFAPMRVELFPFAHVFRPGSRVRVTVEAPGGNRPFWTFDALAASGTVVNEVAHSTSRPSRIVLPVLDDDAPDALPACPSLRGQPCRPVRENPTPTDVQAVASGDDIEVHWNAPRGVPVARTLVGYRITSEPPTTVLDIDATARSAVFADLPEGAYSFVVEAVYDNGRTGGRSTPSNTTSVPAAVTTTTTTTVAPTTTTIPNVTTTTTPVGNASTTTTASGTASPNGGGGGGLLPYTGAGLGLLLVGSSMVLGGWALTGPRRRARR